MPEVKLFFHEANIEGACPSAGTCTMLGKEGHGLDGVGDRPICILGIIRSRCTKCF